MLLGTYQPLYRAACHDGLKKFAHMAAKNMNDGMTVSLEDFGKGWDSRDELGRKVSEAIGMDPVWCFPCRNPKEAFTQSCLSSPNSADLFFLIDAEDYIRIDRVKWEGCVRDGNSYAEDLKDCIAPDGLDDSMCDFLVDINKLQDFRFVCMPSLTYGSAFALRHGLQFYRSSGAVFVELADFEKKSPGFLAGLSKADAEIGRIQKGRLSVPEGVEYDAAQADYLLTTKHMKTLFECSAMPVVVSAAANGFQGIDLCDFFRIALGVDAVGRAYIDLAAWAEGPRDYEGYKTVMAGFRDVYCESRAVIETWLGGGPWPERNGRCPCGSGRKFKKCCGTKYGLC